MLLLSSALLIYHAVLLSWLIFGARKLSRVTFETSKPSNSALPTLTIVVPARNEEKTLGVGLNSLTRLTYPALTIVVVNDRSTDKTKDVIAEFSKKDERIRGVTLTALPNGWLGKNHALQTGASNYESELILFTDADVEISDAFLKKAVEFFLNNSLDHLAAIPRVTARSPFLYPLLGMFGLSFSLFTRPWQGKDPDKDRAVGIGAFNLVKRKSYEAMGGHRKLCLRPDDDLKLALLMKRAGFKTDCISAVDGLQVEWYSNVGELMRGLEKNVMTGFEYSFFKAIIGNVLFAVTFLLPFLLLFTSSGVAFLVSCATVSVLLLSYFGQLYEARMPLLCTPCLPGAALVILFIFARACWLTFINQGVFWRDTFYSLELLRSNRMDPPSGKKRQ